MASSSAPVVVDKSWVCVYPNYLDSTKTIPQGRRVTKGHALATPKVTEISEACKYLGFRHAVEDKCYPRDWLVPGRVRIELPSQIPNKQDLLKRLCDAMSFSRQAKQEPERSNAPAAKEEAKKKKGKK